MGSFSINGEQDKPEPFSELERLRTENQNLQLNLAKITEKLKSYEDLSKFLAEMREHLRKLTEALLAKKAECSALKVQLEDEKDLHKLLQEQLNSNSGQQSQESTRCSTNTDVDRMMLYLQPNRHRKPASRARGKKRLNSIPESSPPTKKDGPRSRLHSK